MKALRFQFKQSYKKKIKRSRFQVFTNVTGGRLKAKMLVARLNALKIERTK